MIRTAEVGTALIILRAIRGMSRKELATASGHLAPELAGFERSVHLPPLSSLYDLTGAMGYPIDLLVDAQAFVRHVRRHGNTLPKDTLPDALGRVAAGLTAAILESAKYRG